MSAAGSTIAPDPFRSGSEIGGSELQPPDRKIDVGQRGRVWIIGRHAEINRQNDDAAFRERLRRHGIVEAIEADPGAAMDLDDGGTRSPGVGPVQPCQQRAITAAPIRDVLDQNPPGFAPSPAIYQRWPGIGQSRCHPRSRAGPCRILAKCKYLD